MRDRSIMAGLAFSALAAAAFSQVGEPYHTGRAPGRAKSAAKPKKPRKFKGSKAAKKANRR